MQWFKSQKGKKPDRILPPPSSSTSTGSEVAPGSCLASKSERLEDLKVAFCGLRKESLVPFVFDVMGLHYLFA